MLGRNSPLGQALYVLDRKISKVLGIFAFAIPSKWGRLTASYYERKCLSLR
jgi:hypothetical protein